jgi:hypothetical protein
MGHAADFVLITAPGITALVILWPDRRSAWQTVGSGLLLALMLVFAEHDGLLVGTALVLGAVTVPQMVWGADYSADPVGLLHSQPALEAVRDSRSKR